ncbi:sorting nexin-4-like [Anthonomus grandis grandis]|uniref:sorting nexin-4-like n=1 Tax=Anthonomus grandis grandis TaxID=2921223 RepID=UPI00216509FD|nr:sorting nexin-4-like [Anthonomus grandis grandis]
MGEQEPRTNGPPEAPEVSFATFQGCLMNHIEISVSESEKRNNGALNLRDFYTVYLIETKPTGSSTKQPRKHATVWRRYSEFERLLNYLRIKFPFVIMPPLPEKRVMFAWQKIPSDTFDPNFIDRRRAGLENFLLRAASHPLLGWDPHFLQFLQEENPWSDTNSYIQLMETKLKTLSVAVRVRKSHPRFEALRDYGAEFQNSVTQLLKNRSRVAERTYAVHKLHANYGRVFSEWSASERDATGDSLQRIGHYLDSFAASIDGALEDEELLADQLKEYLFFAESLQGVCGNREALQLQLEDSEEAVTSRNAERARVRQGKSLGLMSRLFGAVDTEEVREFKANELEQRIREGAALVDERKGQLEEFTQKALKEVERFQKQKVADLSETLANYAFLQLKTAKKGLQTWTQIRECLLNIPTN